VRRSAWPSGVTGAVLRILVLMAGASALVVVVSVPLGLVAHTSLNRALALGFYAVGVFLVALGLLAGNRGPFRHADEDAPMVAVGRSLRRATIDELVETINLSFVMVVIGVVLCAIGVAIDDRYRLM
jgi:hypothetical protein